MHRDQIEQAAIAQCPSKWLDDKAFTLSLKMGNNENSVSFDKGLWDECQDVALLFSLEQELHDLLQVEYWLAYDDAE